MGKPIFFRFQASRLNNSLARCLHFMLLCCLFTAAAHLPLTAQSSREEDRRNYEKKVILNLEQAQFNDIPWIEIFHDSKLRPSEVKRVFEQKLAAVGMENVNKKTLSKFQLYLATCHHLETADHQYVWQDEVLGQIKSARKETAAQKPVSKFTYIGQTQSVFNTNNGRIERVNFHPTNPNIIWASAPEGGLWRSNDAGVNWSIVNDFWEHQSVGDLVYNMNDHNKIYVATDDHDSFFKNNRGVLRSDDAGNTWNIVGLPSATCSQVFKLAMAPDGRTLYACTNEGLFKSSDDGVTWTKNTSLPASTKCNDIEFHPTNPKVIYVTTRSGNDQHPIGGPNTKYFYISTDGGVTFNVQTCPLNSEGRPAQVSVSRDNPDIVYIAVYPAGNYVQPPQGGMVMKYTHSTGIIATIVSPDFKFPKSTFGGAWDFRFEANPNDDNHIIYGCVNVYQSYDGGLTWQTINAPHPDQHDFKWQPGTNKLWFADDGGLGYSTDKGATWTSIKNIQVQQPSSIRSSRHGTIFLTGVQDAGVQVNMGGHWFWPLGGDGLEVVVDPVDSFTVYGSIQTGLYLQRVTYNPATKTSTQKNIMNPTIARGKATWRQKIIIDAADHNTIYTNYQDIFKSTDRGDNWTNLTKGTLGNGSTPIEFLYQAKSDPNVMVAGWLFPANTIKRTTDGGKTWTSITFPPGADLGGTSTTLAFHPSNANIMWVCARDKVKKTSDGGLTWADVPGTLPSGTHLFGIAYQEGTADGFYVCGDVGTIWYRDDNTADYVMFNDGLPHVRVTEIEVLPHINKIRAATWGRGIWESPTYQHSSKPCIFPEQPILLTKVCPNGASLEIGAAPPGYSIVWDKDGSLIAGQTSTSLTVTGTGVYKARYLQNNGYCHGYFSEPKPLTINGGKAANLYADADGDGFGAPNPPASCATAVTNNGDCDDNNATINPYATEICDNSKDDDCDGNTDKDLNKALHFNGLNHSITIPNLEHQSAFTVEAWIKLGDLKNDVVILEWFGGAHWTNISILSGGAFHYNAGGGAWNGGSIIKIGEWTHIAFVHDGYGADNIKAYVNGKLNWMHGFQDQITNTSAKIGVNFIGAMDEFRYWNTALTPAQIQARMNLPLNGNEPNLIRYYTFNHGKPGQNNAGLTILKDKTSNLKHGTLEGFPLTGTTSNWVDGKTYPLMYADKDGDGFGGAAVACGFTKVATNNLDCDDNAATTNPGSPELCGNGVDDNCNGLMDETDLWLGFDGTGDEVTCGKTTGNFGKGNFTVELRFKTKSAKDDFLISKRLNCACDNFWNITLKDGKLGMEMMQNANCGSPSFYPTNAVVNDEKWHHVAIAREGTTLKIYIDGVLDITINSKHDLNNTADLRLGGNPCNRNFNGLMDEVRIWNIARTASDINTFKNASLRGNETGLLAYYDFNNPNATAGGSNTAATTLKDRTANKNDGTLLNFALSGANSNWLGGPAVSATYYADADNDGYGDPNKTIKECTAPAGYVNKSGDCDDTKASINPGAKEICDNNVDDNCDGKIDENCACPITISGIVPKTPDCPNANNGSLTISATGVASIEYALNSGVFQASNVFNGLAEGTYTVTARDKNNITCTATQSATINKGEDKVPPSVICPPSTATVNPTSGCKITIPDYAALLNPSDNCAAASAIKEAQDIPAGEFATSGDGAIVTIKYTATDGATPANTTTCTVALTVVAPEINVKGNNADIADGDLTPSPDDHTNFGVVSVGKTFSRSFSIQNTGGINMGIAGITSTNPAYIISGAPTTVAAKSTATFTITITPQAAVTYDGTIKISNGDCNEGEYDFAITCSASVPSENDFVITVKTDNPGESGPTEFTIPTFTGETYNYEVDWNNDGVYEQTGIKGNVTHIYGAADTYTLRIKGTFPRIYFANVGDAKKLLDVKQWGANKWTSMEHAFWGCENLDITAADIPDLSSVTDMFNMFRSCTMLKGPANIGTWNTSQVTKMTQLFQYAEAFNQPIGNWNTAKVTDMFGMFGGATVFNQPINNWDTKQVETMYGMFLSAKAFNQDLSGWKTENVFDLTVMFSLASSFNQSLGSWSLRSGVSMGNMLDNCGMDCNNYSSTLSGWANNPATPSGRTLGAEGRQYGTNAAAARNVLTTTKGWTITGDAASGTECSSPSPSDDFVIAIKTDNPGSSNSTSFTIPTFPGETYDYEVDWNNDGKFDKSGITGDATYDYGNPGTYTLRIRGAFPRIYFNGGGHVLKLLDVKQWGTNKWTSMQSAFNGCENLDISATDRPDLSRVKDMSDMFRGCKQMKGPANIGNWNTSAVTNMKNMFYLATAFNQPIGSWNTAAVTDIFGMFAGAAAFNQPIGNWNTGAVTDMRIMFTQASSFNQNLGTWSINPIAMMNIMFGDCGMDCINYSSTLIGWANNPTTPPGRTLGAEGRQYGTNAAAARALLTTTKGWTITGDAASGVDCTTPLIITVKTDNGIGVFGESGPTEFTITTFPGETYNYEVDWNNDGTYEQTGIKGDVTHNYGAVGTYTLRIKGAFPRIYFNQTGDIKKLIDVKQWGTNKWTSMGAAFWGCSNLDVTAIDVPDLSSVTDMYNVFASCSQLKGPANIGNWNTSSVTNMSEMFAWTNLFNQPLDNWDTRKVTHMGGMFSEAKKFNQPIGNWKTDNVGSMYGMFSGATAFNQDISKWKTDKVLEMRYMFIGATAFNQPIGNWNTGAVEKMGYMFDKASSFNQNLGAWVLNPQVEVLEMLNGCGMDCNNYSGTLIGWANNPATPSGSTLGAVGRQYGTNAAAARALLTTTKGWTITGDAPNGSACGAQMQADDMANESLGHSSSISLKADEVHTSSGSGSQANITVTVQPNPFSEATSIHVSSDKTCKARLRITDLTGRVIKETSLVTSATITTLIWDAGDVSPGIYFIRVETDQGSVACKVIRT